MGRYKNNYGFPIPLFVTYLAYYSGQAVYNTYLNLYLTEIGMTATQIGVVISVSTIGILLSQLFFGMVSDKSGKKVRVLQFLYICAIATVLLFYLTRNYLLVCALVSIFSMVFVPIVPLNDNLTLEQVENTRWDFGQIRAGGTLGYSLTALVSGYCLQNRYSNIFIWIFVSMIVCLICTKALLKVQQEKVQKCSGRDTKLERKEKGSVLAVVCQDKVLLGLIAFNLVHGMGINFFHSYYPIYFSEIGGDSKWIGVMIFACSLAEIPFFIGMNRIVKRQGINKVLLEAGLLTGIRWLLLSQLRNPYLIVACNLLHGFSFSAVTCCLLNYINENIQFEYRARTQVLNSVISMVCSKSIFGFLGGTLFDVIGAPKVLLVLGSVMIVTTFVFVFWKKRYQASE